MIKMIAKTLEQEFILKVCEEIRKDKRSKGFEESIGYGPYGWLEISIGYKRKPVYAPIDLREITESYSYPKANGVTNVVSCGVYVYPIYIPNILPEIALDELYKIVRRKFPLSDIDIITKELANVNPKEIANDLCGSFFDLNKAIEFYKKNMGKRVREEIKSFFSKIVK